MSIYILMMHLYAWGITDVNMFSVVAARSQQQQEGVVLLCIASSTWVDRD